MKGIRMCYYGDDFTGSTDAMEALTLNGFRTVLFLRVPEKEEMEEAFSHVDCFGIAGLSRQMTPQEMESELRPILERLKSYRIPIIHYKICSTFDSSESIGNIGKVIELGKEIFDEQETTIVSVGVPQLKRYVVFGNLFAQVNDQVYRLDRHPTMSKHPVTPMNESRLKLHLQKQTNLQISEMNVLEIENEQSEQSFQRKVNGEADIVIMDTLNKKHLSSIAKYIQHQSEKTQQFVIGSSGIEYGLSNYWQKTESDKSLETLLAERTKENGPILVVSGSCSPVTKAQIEYSIQADFVGVKIDCPQLISPETAGTYLDELIESAVKAFDEGRHVILYTALGPNDNDIQLTNELIEKLALPTANTGEIIGSQLGKLVKEVIGKRKVNRIVSAGGDTSGNVIKELGLYAIEMVREIDPGGPLCKSYADDALYDHLEIALKGGQVGDIDYFVKVANIT